MNYERGCPFDKVFLMMADVHARPTRKARRSCRWHVCLLGFLLFQFSVRGQFPGVFGIGGDSHTGRNLQPWIPQMAALGIRMMRTAEPGQMDYLAGNDIQFGGLLFATPPGDTLDGPGRLPVKDIPAWSAYVADRVMKAGRRVHYWEVWNEPPNFIGPDQTAADYAKIVVSAYDAAHKIDPGCKVGLAAKSVDVNFLEHAILAGAKDHFDYVVLHPYESLGAVADGVGYEPGFLNIVPAVRKMLAARDPARENVPIIFTEIGCDAHKGEDIQAQALVKAYTLGIAQGVDCIEWFEGMDGDSGPMGLLDAQGRARPAYTAMGQMIKYLGEHPEYLGQNPHRECAYCFRGASNRVVWIEWARKGELLQQQYGQVYDFVDPITGQEQHASTWNLTSAPVLILGLGAEGAEKIPPGFGSDYAMATSVSLTPDLRNLHPAKWNEEHGVRALSRTSFYVDPAFLTYTPVPIEISVTVRTDDPARNAGFKLVYESSGGFKNCGWYTVPGDGQWHTMSWKIDDDEFVGMWAYNFSLVSDGNQYDKYSIREVTVTKTGSPETSP